MGADTVIRNFFRNELSGNDTDRIYEKQITSFANKHTSEEDLRLFHEIMEEGSDMSYPAFFCLSTIYRHNRDYSKLLAVIQYAESRPELNSRASLKHIRIMYEIHSESLYDYDDLLREAHESACELCGNAGYQHTFANAFATICENCLREDLEPIIDKWFDAALYCVDRAIELEPNYAKYYSTKARIVVQKNRFEEANNLILQAIDKEDSGNKSYYALNVCNYQYYRAMFAIRKQQWFAQGESRRADPQGLPAGLSEMPQFRPAEPYAFVSYSHSDPDRVLHYVRKLKELGVNLWFDGYIQSGSDWTEVIGSHLVNSSFVLLFLSHTALASRNVRNEIRQAQKHEIPIVPIYLEDVKLTPGAELQLESYNALYSYKMSEAQLLKRISEDLKAVRTDSGRRSGPASGTKEPRKAAQKPSENPDFRIIEKKLQGKTADLRKCEDMIVHTDSFIAVIDGATSKNDRTYRGATGGKLAAAFLAGYIRDGKLPEDIDGRTAVCRMQAALRQYASEHRFEEKNIHLCASAAIFSRARQQIWSVGDCQFMVNGKPYTFPKKIDAVTAQARAMLIHMLLASGKVTEADLLRNDEARALLLQEMSLQRFLENADGEFGYSVFSSRGEIRDVFILDVPSDAEIVLATDGYPELYPTLQESEQHLQELLKTDPLCYKRFRSTKGLQAGNQCFDDRAYIRFRLG